MLSFLIPQGSKLGAVIFDRDNHYPFTVQNLMWVIFFVGLGELIYRMVLLRELNTGLNSDYLSTDPNMIYDADDIIELRSKVYNKKDKVAQLINLLTLRYQASNYSVSDTHQMLNSQLELMQYRLDIEYSSIRYITWLLPTIGFIGTVLGISNSLSTAGSKSTSDPDFFLSISIELALAFNTTFLALVMSAILVFLMHLITAKEEIGIESCAKYCLNNFISRLVSK
ncbi:MAG: MotA/TolQ/ExbB proton channel family protein [Deltaproteobacteria bacterium]|nr:MotA/TolQ/ExbB proton channel family protein [Deltaproteobacteria bacterium]